MVHSNSDYVHGNIKVFTQKPSNYSRRVASCDLTSSHPKKVRRKLDPIVLSVNRYLMISMKVLFLSLKHHEFHGVILLVGDGYDFKLAQSLIHILPSITVKLLILHMRNHLSHRRLHCPKCGVWFRRKSFDQSYWFEIPSNLFHVKFHEPHPRCNKGLILRFKFYFLLAAWSFQSFRLIWSQIHADESIFVPNVFRN